MSTTTNIDYLRRNLLDDPSGTIWGTSELYDSMATETYAFFGELTRVSDTVFESYKPFWVPYGTGVGNAPVLDICVDDVVLDDTEYEVDYLVGRVILATAAEPTSRVTATFYACNLWAVAQQALMRRVNSAEISGEKKNIRLGPLAKSVTGPSEMVASYNQRISMFARFARQWREKSSQEGRVRM
jgi:hypothetical protein